jgi:hypothetical protein
MLKVYVLPIAAAVWLELRDGSACGERSTLLSQRNSLYKSGTDSVEYNSVIFIYQVQSQLTSPIHMLYRTYQVKEVLCIIIQSHLDVHFSIHMRYESPVHTKYRFTYKVRYIYT